jgi:hypothetical protein
MSGGDPICEGMAMTLAVGIGGVIGAAFGALWDNVTMGIGIGIAFGAGLGAAVIDYQERRSGRD